MARYLADQHCNQSCVFNATPTTRRRITRGVRICGQKCDRTHLARSTLHTAVFKNPENRAFQGGRFSRFSIAFFAFSAEAFFFGSAFFAFSAVRVCSVPAASSRLTVVCSVTSSSHCGAPLRLSGKKFMHGGAPRSALVAWGEHWRLRSCFFRSPSRLIQDLPRVWQVGHAPTGM